MNERTVITENSASPRREVKAGLFAFLLLFLFVAGCAVVPQPFTAAELKSQAQEERTRLFAGQEPLAARLTLYDAMARAVKYNLDHQVKRIEEALARGNLDKARYDLLPQLVASARYSERNNDSGSASKSLLTGSQSLEVSTSQDREQFSADIIHVWNALDFGVGYTQALQMADEALISEESRRKAVQNIVQDVRYAYWKAVSAEILLPEMDLLLERVENALARAREMEKTRVQDPAKTLAYQQELLETVRQLWTMRRELSLAKTELAALMNMAPGTDFALDPGEEAGQAPARPLSLDLLEERALENRPEVRVESYNRRISANEVKKAMLSMLPGLEINLNANYDENSFLYNNSWLQAGLSISWNAFNILSGPQNIRTAEIQQDLAARRYMATAMMVLTQVHLAHQGYGLARKEYDIAGQLEDVLQRRLGHAKAAKEAQAGSEQEEIRNQAAALSAKMNRGLAFAELQGALGRLLSSTGIDPLPGTLPEEGLQTLSHLICAQESAAISAFWQEISPGSDGVPLPSAPEAGTAAPDTALEISGALPAKEEAGGEGTEAVSGDDGREQEAAEPGVATFLPEPEKETAPPPPGRLENAVGDIPSPADKQPAGEVAGGGTVTEAGSAPEAAESDELSAGKAATAETRPEEEKGEAASVAEEMPPARPGEESPSEGKSFRLKLKSSTLPNVTVYTAHRGKSQAGMPYHASPDRPVPGEREF